MKRFLLVALAAGSLLTSCKKNDDILQPGIFRGPEVSVHGGKAWTWIQLAKNGTPEKLAVTLTDEALNSVPIGHEDDGDHSGHNMENSYTLKLHPKALASTPFNHVGMGWNPMGHEPEPIYGIPHFDFHFYLPKPEEIAAIPPYNLAPEKFDNWPAPDYFPPTYMNFGGGAPQMGAHWVDVTSPEINGAPFTQTFIYGSYDGKVNFYEPMITLDFLKNTQSFERSIPQSAKVQKSGYYPTKMLIEKSNGLTHVILNGFVYRQQS